MAGNGRSCVGPQSKVAGVKGGFCRCDAKLAGAADTAPPAAGYDALQRAERKVLRHVVTLACAIALINYIDRGNLAFAALSLNKDRQFSAGVFGTGASLFFVAICLFQVPSNLVMVRVGFRPWLAFLLVGWGSVATAMMGINSVWSFYLLRFLLGAFEAGAFPAMWFMLSCFFPRRSVIRPYAYLIISALAANVIGALLATGLLAMDGLGGLKGWQWLFMLEGIPSVLLGVVVFFTLPGSISEARWLTPEERDALEAAVAADRLPGPIAQDVRSALVLLRRLFTNAYMYVIFFNGVITSIAGAIWFTFTPIIIANLLAGTALSPGATVAAAAGRGADLRPIALSILPFALALPAAFLVAWSSQRTDELFLHVAVSLLISGVATSLFSPLAAASAAAGFAALCVSLAAAFAPNGPGMAMVARLCKGKEQVVAQPAASTFNMAGSAIGPPVVAALLKLGGFKWVTIVMGCCQIMCALLVLVLRAWVQRDGGFPDGGVGRRYSEAPLAHATWPGASKDVSSPASGTAAANAAGACRVSAAAGKADAV